MNVNQFWMDGITRDATESRGTSRHVVKTNHMSLKATYELHTCLLPKINPLSYIWIQSKSKLRNWNI